MKTLILVFLFLGYSLAYADIEYSTNTIVEAIYQAEGGARAQYPYGIRSIKCDTKAECRKICVNTVNNNKKRYLKADKKLYPTFVQFLGSRYCPTTGKLSPTEKKLNKNWETNVNYYLIKGTK